MSVGILTPCKFCSDREAFCVRACLAWAQNHGGTGVRGGGGANVGMVEKTAAEAVVENSHKSSQLQ